MCGIYIGFSKSKSKFPILGWLIMWIEKRPYSHTYAKWYDPFLDQHIIYEARGLTVHLVSEHKFLEECEIVKEYRIELENDSIKKKVIKRAFENIESKYSIRQLLGIGIVKLFKNFGKVIKNPFGNKDQGYVCSEAMADLLINTLDTPIYKDRDAIGPSDIDKTVQNMPNAHLVKKV